MPPPNPSVLVDTGGLYKYVCPLQYTIQITYRGITVTYGTTPCAVGHACFNIRDFEGHLAKYHPTITLAHDTDVHRIHAAPNDFYHNAMLQRVQRYTESDEEWRIGIQCKTAVCLRSDWADKYPPSMIMFVVNPEHTVLHICYAQDCSSVTSAVDASRLYRISLSTTDCPTPYTSQTLLEQRVVQVLAAYMKLATRSYKSEWLCASYHKGYCATQMYAAMMTADDRPQTTITADASALADTLTAGYIGNQHKTFTQFKKDRQDVMMVTIGHSHWYKREERQGLVKYTTEARGKIQYFILHGSSTLEPVYRVPFDVMSKQGFIALAGQLEPVKTLQWPVQKPLAWLEKHRVNWQNTDEVKRAADTYRLRSDVQRMFKQDSSENVSDDADSDTDAAMILNNMQNNNN